MPFPTTCLSPPSGTFSTLHSPFDIARNPELGMVPPTTGLLMENRSHVCISRAGAKEVKARSVLFHTCMNSSKGVQFKLYQNNPKYGCSCSQKKNVLYQRTLLTWNRLCQHWTGCTTSELSQYYIVKLCYIVPAVFRPGLPKGSLPTVYMSLFSHSALAWSCLLESSIPWLCFQAATSLGFSTDHTWPLPTSLSSLGHKSIRSAKLSQTSDHLAHYTIIPSLTVVSSRCFRRRAYEQHISRVIQPFSYLPWHAPSSV